LRVCYLLRRRVALESTGRNGYPIPMSKTILAIGAHYDDCVFGIPGLLLQAVSKHYRVVILAMIGDYTQWGPAKGRADELRATTIRLAKERGMEFRFLKYASMGFDPNPETRRATAEVVADVKPDLAFMLWNRDRHPDHEAAAAISAMALRQPAAILGDSAVRGPSRIYAFDNGPGHTIGFEPNTFIDISPEWPAASAWLGELMAFVRNRPYVAGAPDAATEVKETLARYRGLACGARHAEAIWATKPYKQELF
jgi:LmbE family N-acetylglucosaminyl deacetylase